MERNIKIVRRQPLAKEVCENNEEVKENLNNEKGFPHKRSIVPKNNVRSHPRDMDEIPYRIKDEDEFVEKNDEPKENLLFVKEKYPSPEGLANIQDIKILKNLAVGRFSEFTAISTYLYQHFEIQKPEYSEIRSRLEQIAKVEMKHLALLQDAVVKLGGDATYSNGNGISWNGRFVNTTKSIPDFLKMDIKEELIAIEEYSQGAKKVSNLSLANLFRRIIKDEELHVLELKRLLSKYFNID